MSNTILSEIWRFPVKGFPGQLLGKTHLVAGRGIPNDRRFAITRGTESDGNWMPARSYYINSRVDGMLQFQIAESGSDQLTLTNPAGVQVQLDFADRDSIKSANGQIIEFLEHVGIEKDAPVPQVIERRNSESNWDYPNTEISIINAASVRDIADAFGRELEPVRFRGNLVIDNLPAWEEFNLMGKRIRIGAAELEVLFPIVRCPAPGVNPNNGERDIDFASAFPDTFGHAYCGMYAVVVKDGDISADDTIEVMGDAKTTLREAQEEAPPYPMWPRIVEVCDVSIDRELTKITLKNPLNWPFPDAKPGQRIRLHLGPNRTATEYITQADADHYHLEVSDSQTGDPLTQSLRKDLKPGQRIVVSGPFGRV